MSVTSHPNIPFWIQNRIVGFFNQARNVDMILDGSIQDHDGTGKTMGRTLAARVLRERNALQRRRFTDFEEIDHIRGIGTGTIKDLVFSFGKSADEVFKKSMYDSGTIYQDNWPLEYFRFEIEDKNSFLSIVQNNDNLRQFIIEKVGEVSAERNVNPSKSDAMIADISNAYMDDYSNSSPTAAYALALWFYKFDADNWFSWERIQEQTIQYFDYNSNTYPWFMNLHLFKGFTNRGIISPGLSSKDLPVIVNWAEQTITFWVSALYD